jgi:hypothetical protein
MIKNIIYIYEGLRTKALIGMGLGMGLGALTGDKYGDYKEKEITEKVHNSIDSGYEEEFNKKGGNNLIKLLPEEAKKEAYNIKEEQKESIKNHPIVKDHIKDVKEAYGNAGKAVGASVGIPVGLAAGSLVHRVTNKKNKK